jgi:hypothetical protein
MIPLGFFHLFSLGLFTYSLKLEFNTIRTQNTRKIDRRNWCYNKRLKELYISQQKKAILGPLRQVLKSNFLSR